MSFTRLLHERCKHPMDPDEQRLCYKAQGRAFAKVRGVPVPELVQERTPLAGLVEPGCDRFVIKPNQGCTARAIIVAERSDGMIRNHLGQNVDGWNDIRTWDAWIDWLHWCMERDKETAGPYPDEWIVEGWAASNPHPMEYGVYCVNGTAFSTAFFVRQVDRGGHRPGPRARVCNWTRGWEHAGPVLQSSRREKKLAAPSEAHRREIIEYAERLSRDWPGPFVRVDFLEGDDGPVFIEFTPRPAGGKISLHEPWDSVMGAVWDLRR